MTDWRDIEGFRILEQIKADALADDGEELRERLRSEPRTVLQEYALCVPEGVEVEVLQNTAKKVYLVLPAREEYDSDCDDDDVDVTHLCRTTPF